LLPRQQLVLVAHAQGKHMKVEAGRAGTGEWTFLIQIGITRCATLQDQAQLLKCTCVCFFHAGLGVLSAKRSAFPALCGS
jgi:hypothetical protein